MIVVADTSPLNYLIQVDCADLLPRLYKQVLIPPGVMHELSHPSAPPVVKHWLARVPDWLRVTPPGAPVPAGEMSFLGIGEREAIQIAQHLKADLLLIDERKGSTEARRRGLRTSGTLGVLLTAGQLRLIDPESVYRQLMAQTSFRASASVEAHFLDLTRPGRQ